MKKLVNAKHKPRKAYSALTSTVIVHLDFTSCGTGGEQAEEDFRQNRI